MSRIIIGTLVMALTGCGTVLTKEGRAVAISTTWSRDCQFIRQIKACCGDSASSVGSKNKLRNMGGKIGANTLVIQGYTFWGSLVADAYSCPLKESTIITSPLFKGPKFEFLEGKGNNVRSPAPMGNQ